MKITSNRVDAGLIIPKVGDYLSVVYDSDGRRTTARVVWVDVAINGNRPASVTLEIDGQSQSMVASEDDGIGNNWFLNDQWSTLTRSTLTVHADEEDDK
jgi:hypothetical protein